MTPLFLQATETSIFQYTFYIILFLALSVFWVIQFAELMVLSDKDFPGRYDKALWVAAFVCTLFLGAFAFFWWRRIMVDGCRLRLEQAAAAQVIA